VKPEEAGLGLMKPLLWRSRFLSDTVVAMTVRDVQVLFPGTQKSGAPPVQKAQQFLMYCAGYGVDPRIGQAYMIPFMEENRANWQMGLHYTVAMRMASESGAVLTFQIDPDPKEWPLKYPGDDWAATITILRKAPLLPVSYSARLGSVAQKSEGQLGRAWSDRKVGWAHMFRVTLIRRAFREVAALGGYGAEEFGQVEPQYDEVASQVEFMPPMSGDVSNIVDEAEGVPDTPEVVPPADAPAPAPVVAPAGTSEATQAPGKDADDPWADEGDLPAAASESEPPASLAFAEMTDDLFVKEVSKHLKRVAGADATAGKAFNRKHYQADSLRGLNRAQLNHAFDELVLRGNDWLKGWGGGDYPALPSG